MGGSLGSVFSSSPAGANGQASPLQSIVQGATKGAGTAFGQGMQQRPMGGGGGSIQPPAAAPVDASFFAPMVLQQGSR